MELVLALLAAYVIGSINFAVFVARMHGVDIRQEGSGNPGMSNVLRTVGKVPAAMVLAGDVVKGVAGAYAGLIASGTTDFLSPWAFAGGFAAVVGHCYPIFHKFRGGKGVATGAGVALFTMPVVAAIVIAGWFLMVRVMKLASVASLIAVAASVPLALWQGIGTEALIWFLATIVLIVWRHKANIERVFSGSEQKVSS
ncbi:MAG: glycerol-3-phosphate 1-O-acyltransferase PlsY [Acidimicrobiia bacterium]|nr:glycerol-3-phosphate 1-O-acyltransferase PlsY [Acidimicrobiia bacterium]